MMRALRPFLQEALHPWTHCCCGLTDISSGFKMMCAVLSGWALVQVILASVSLARHAAGSVWESEFEFDTRGLSVFRLLAHLYLAVVMSIAVYAAWKREVKKAQLFVLGFVGFALMQMIFQLVRVMSIEADAAVYQRDRCEYCNGIFPLEGQDCCAMPEIPASCPKIAGCTEYDVAWFKSYAYLVGLTYLIWGLIASVYVILVARSFACHLEAGDGASSGLASADSLANPLDTAASSVYFKMDSLLGGSRGVE